MAIEIIDLTDSPPSPPRSSKAARILNFGAASVEKRQSGKASRVATGFRSRMHGQMVPLPFPHGTRLKDHWTQEEHELFLIGLEKCGKGRWSRIASDYLTNKTAKQVQRYAACYFRHFPSAYAQNHKTKKRTYSAVNNLMRACASYSVPMMVNKPQKPLILFPVKALSFPISPYGGGSSSTNYRTMYQFQKQTGGASTSMTATASGEVDLELRLGRSQ